MINSNDLVIEKIHKTKDIDICYGIVLLAGYDIYQKYQLTHWYPPVSLEYFREQIKFSDIYRVTLKGKIAATFSLFYEPTGYADKIWSLEERKQSIFISRLAVLPTLQNNRIGSHCLKYIESIACNNGFSIKFDSLTAYKTLTRFYIHRDYEVLRVEKIINTRNNELVMNIYNKSFKT